MATQTHAFPSGKGKKELFGRSVLEDFKEAQKGRGILQLPCAASMDTLLSPYPEMSDQTRYFCYVISNVNEYLI